MSNAASDEGSPLADSFHSSDSPLTSTNNANSSLSISAGDHPSFEASDVDEDLSLETDPLTRANSIDKTPISPPPLFVVDPRLSRISPRKDEGSVLSSISPLHNTSITYPTAPAPSSSLNWNDNTSINLAFIFIEPQANNEAVRDLVVSTIFENLVEFNVENCIKAEYDISSAVDGFERLVDSHFGEVAAYAVHRPIEKVKIPRKKFHEKFGETYLQVKKEKRLHNALKGLVECGCTPDQMYDAWQEAESLGKILRVSDHILCGNLVLNQRNVYIINGFYMSVRGQYLASYSSIHAYCIQWTEETLTWNDFQKKLIGGDDPATAEAGSLRSLIYNSYEELGLESRPTISSNALYVSASPLRALVDRCNWLSREIGEDEYGRMLLGRGVPESVVSDWCNNVIVDTPSTEKSSVPMKVHSYVDGMSTSQCTEALLQIYDRELFGDIVEANNKCSPSCIIS